MVDTSENRRIRWFLAGSALLLLGAIAGVLLSRSPTPSRAVSTALVSWPQSAGATSVEIALGGRLVDRIPARVGAYRLHELWPATTYTVLVTL
ncbi:MAG: hypothetical protein WBQ18_10370, partial [Solirubrobacteraceae bacterium]